MQSNDSSMQGDSKASFFFLRDAVDIVPVPPLDDYSSIPSRPQMVLDH